MNELVELIYQWHQGAGFKGIRRSLGFDRKTIRKYVQLAQEAGVQRGKSFPPESGSGQPAEGPDPFGAAPARPRPRTCWIRIRNGFRSC